MLYLFEGLVLNFSIFGFGYCFYVLYLSDAVDATIWFYSSKLLFNGESSEFCSVMSKWFKSCLTCYLLGVSCLDTSGVSSILMVEFFRETRGLGIQRRIEFKGLFKFIV